MNCTYCQWPQADLYTPNGEVVCQRCDSHFRAMALSQRAASGGGVVGAVEAQMTFASPTKLIVFGVAMMVGAPALGVFEMAMMDGVHIKGLGIMFLIGFFAFARGVSR